MTDRQTFVIVESLSRLKTGTHFVLLFSNISLYIFRNNPKGLIVVKTDQMADRHDCHYA